jgi:hypothetical protein
MAFRKASSIEVPDILFHTLKTGSPEIDLALSELGGIVPSQVIFMTGKPGSGKTTLALVSTSKIQITTKKPGAFISLEMSDYQLALSKKKYPTFDTMWVDTEFSLKKTIKALIEMKPSSVVLDSIQMAAGLLVHQKESSNFNTAQKDIVNAFTKFAKETFTPVFLIGHCSKGGLYLGPSHLEHQIDTHLHVEYDEEMGLRTFRAGKNRFGGTNEVQLFGITGEGVWLGSPYVTDTELPDGDPALALEHGTLARSFSINYQKFQESNAKASSINASEARSFANTIINYLKKFDADKIIKDSRIKDPNRVKLGYHPSKVADCNAGTGLIRIGKKMMDKGFQIGPIGYGREKVFILRNCKSREQLFLWVMCHEWTHLYNGMQHHKTEFFRQVEGLYIRLLASLPKVAPTS